MDLNLNKEVNKMNKLEVLKLIIAHAENGLRNSLIGNLDDATEALQVCGLVSFNFERVLNIYSSFN